VAHVVIAPDGRAVVVILTASPPLESTDLDQTWSQLSGGIHFAGTIKVRAMFGAGAMLLRSMPRPQWSERWWLWSHGNDPIGFSHDSLDGSSPVRRTVRKNPDGTATAVNQKWTTSGGEMENQASMLRSDVEPNPNSPFFPFFEEATNIGDNVTRALHLHDSTIELVTAIPAQGGLLLSRHIIDLLSGVDESQMGFWTERFPGLEKELLSAPLLVLARYTGQVGELKCVEAQVNGTGWISQWYFRDDGALDHADFAGDLHLRPSDENEITSLFADDRRLTPRGN
jgi:hypothetical protein